MDYTDAERHLIAQLAAGCRPAVPACAVSDRVSAQPATASARPQAARLRASALGRILTRAEQDAGELARGIHLCGYWIDGDLDLTQAHHLSADAGRAVVPLLAESCHIDGLVNLAGARAASLILRDTVLRGFTARGADISGGLTLDGCVIQATHGQPAEDGSDAQPAVGGGGPSLPVRSAVGRIDLDGCAIGGDLNARGLRVICPAGQPTDHAPPPLEIDADNAVVRGSVDLGTRDSSGGERTAGDTGVGLQPVIYANFDNADIFGDFRASGAWFAPLSGQPGAAPPECLDLRGAQVRGDLCLDHIRACGRIRLEDADIAQDLELGGAHLVQAKGVALDAPGIVVHGSVHLVDRRTQSVGRSRPGLREGGTSTALDPRLVAYGQLRFTRAQIGGDFDASGATVCAVDVSIEGVALDLRSAEIGGSVYLDGRRDVGPGLFVGLINLIQVQVNGSLVFSGSWFRAPCGRMMGPEQIDAELYSDSEMRFALFEAGIDPESPCYRGFTVADLYYGYEDRLPDLARSSPAPASNVKTQIYAAGLDPDVEVFAGLAYGAKGLWRLRGGCRAIAIEDARVAGAVLFGTAIDIHAPRGGDASCHATPGIGPSVVVGAIDMDRVRIEGELRLTGGIFRAVTPLVDGLAQADAPKPSDDAADVSLSYPSTVGWTELMARTCLTLRGAKVGGRLDTRFFGALPTTVDRESMLTVSKCQTWRQVLNLVPEDAERLDGGSTRWLTKELRAHQRACEYALEMLYMLAFVSRAERAADHAYGATRPYVPEVQDAPGCYHLRPDGRFDLSDARLAAIHDHPAHGWPTSDGHLCLNGCTYDFITLDAEESRIDAPGADNSSLAGIWRKPNRYLTYAERTGRSWWVALFDGLAGLALGLVLWGWQKVLGFCLIPAHVRSGARFLFSASSAGARPSWESGVGRWWQKACIRRRANRYRRYARRSVRRRNDNRCRPAYRRIAWLEQQYHGADPSPQDFLPQPYEALCRVMRANGYREDADLIAAAKRRQRSRATLLHPVTLVGEAFLRWTSNYGYAPARVVCVTLLFLAFGGATVQIAADHHLLTFESLQTEGVAIMNTLADAPGARSEVAPREDLDLAPVLYAIDRFVPIIEFGYAAEWSVAEWRPLAGPSDGPAYEPRLSVVAERAAKPSWPEAVRSLMSFGLPSSGQFAALGGELLRLPAFLLAWAVGSAIAGFDFFAAVGSGAATADSLDWSLGQMLDAPVQAIVELDPETALRWLGAIYHGFGWALISMAIVTFTGVMRRD